MGKKDPTYHPGTMNPVRILTQNAQGTVMESPFPARKEFPPCSKLALLQGEFSELRPFFFGLSKGLHVLCDLWRPVEWARRAGRLVAFNATSREVDGWDWAE